MTLLSPNLLLHLIWLLPVLLLLVWWGSRRRRQRLASWIPDAGLAAELTRSVSTSRRRWRQGLLAVALLLVVLAIAQPRWGTHLVRSPSQSRDILVVLDTSRSMLAQDIPPSRLQHAKLIIRRLVEVFPGDRFGLIAFAGDAFLECPLTQNRSGILLFLSETDTTSIPVGGTNLQRALELALKAFEAAEGNHRAVLLITDGEELQGNADEVLGEFREADIPIFVVGLGDPVIGSYIQIEGNKFITDAEGNRVRSRLNEAALQAISQAAGGTYVQSTVAYDGTDHLEQKIAQLIPAEQQAETSLRPIERYQVPLLVALVLLLVRLGLGERREVTPMASRLARHSALLALLLLCLTAVGQDAPPQAEPPKPDPRLPALQSRLEAATTALERAFCHYNLGVVYQETSQLEQAASHYRQAVDLAGDASELKARAYQNLGAIRHLGALSKVMQDPDATLEELAVAETHYREALRYGQASREVAVNQQRLLQHRQMAEQFKQMQQQQQQRMQEAQEKMQEALEQQQQANQTPQDSPQKQDQQHQAKSKNQQAQTSLQDLADHARQHNQDQAADQLDSIRDQLEQAQEKQEQALDAQQSPEERQEAGEEAEETLAEALRQMTGEEQEQQGESQDQQTADNSDSQDQQEGQQGEQGDQQEQQQSSLGEEPPPEEGAEQQAEVEASEAASEAESFSRLQALRLLEEMQESERDLKQEMKRRMGPAKPGAEPERNW